MRKSFNPPEMSIDPFSHGWGIKHKWEPLFSSCSHFVTFELLHLWRQATVIVAGCDFIFISFRIMLIKFATHRFRIQLFRTLSSGCPFGFPCGRPSWTECFISMQCCSSLSISSSYAWNILAFQFSAPRNS